jgi:signal transduction histidine kinase
MHAPTGPEEHVVAPCHRHEARKGFTQGQTRRDRSKLRVQGNEVYLIAREAISNALRHANASMVEVDLEYLTDSFRLKVRDDGSGFTAEAVLEKKQTISDFRSCERGRNA